MSDVGISREDQMTSTLVNRWIQAASCEVWQNLEDKLQNQLHDVHVAEALVEARTTETDKRVATMVPDVTILDFQLLTVKS
jgi:hypothetical protein